MRKAIISILFIVLSVSIHAQNAALSHNKIIEDGQEFYLYEVQESEGFMAIGRKFGVAYQDIIAINQEATKDGLQVGQILRIPVMKGRNTNQKEVKSDDFVYHKVAAGETLFFISRMYGVAISDIVKNNPGADKVLSIGQELKIPKVTAAAKVDYSKEEHKAEQINVKDSFHYHIVQPKETAFGIAGKHQISLEELAAANPGLETNMMQPGMKIRIPDDKTPNTSSDTSEELSDTRYVYHRIKNGETLESIAGLYSIPVDIIIKSNTFGEALPPVGYMLKIPHSYEYTVEIETQDQHIYTVNKKDDIRDIAVKYQVPIMDIQAANPHVKKWTKLKKGMQLIIPTLQVESVDSMVTRIPESKEKEDLARYFENQKKSLGDTINVSFLWPLFLEKNDTINTIKQVDPYTKEVTYKSRHPKTIYPSNTGMFREFYYGALMALNELKAQGATVRIKHYDTKRGVINIMKVLNDSSLLESDLIIGPAFHSHSRPVSDFCIANHIRLIVPYLSECECLESNPYIYQVFPTPGVEYAHITRQVAKRYSDANIIVVKSKPGDERQTIFTELLRSELYNPDSLMTRTISYKEIDFNRDQMGGLTALLSRERQNLIIIPDEKEKLYTRVVPVMENYLSRHKDIKIKLLGFSEYQRFELSELESLYNVECELYTPFYADVLGDEERMKQFRTDYANYFNSLPEHTYPYFSLIGYDLVTFFIKGLDEYGNQLENHLKDIDHSGLSVKLDFERVNNWGGFVNKTMYAVEYTKDYEIKLIEE